MLFSLKISSWKTFDKQAAGIFLQHAEVGKTEMKSKIVG